GGPARAPAGFTLLSALCGTPLAYLPASKFLQASPGWRGWPLAAAPSPPSPPALPKASDPETNTAAALSTSLESPWWSAKRPAPSESRLRDPVSTTRPVSPAAATQHPVAP